MYDIEREKLKIPNGQSGTVIWRTDIAMAKAKQKRRKKTMVNKILHRKLKIEQHEPNLKKTSVNSGSPAG